MSNNREPQLSPVLLQQRHEQPCLICRSGITKVHTNTLNTFNCESISRPSAYRQYAVWSLLLHKQNYAEICTNTTLTYTNNQTLLNCLSGSLPVDAILLPSPAWHAPTTSCSRICKWRALLWEETVCPTFISKFKSSLL